MSFGQEYEAAQERAAEMERAVQMQAFAVGQQVEQRRRSTRLFEQEPYDMAQVIHDATIDDDNVSSADERRHDPRVDAYNIATPPRSRPSSRPSSWSSSRPSTVTTSSSSSSEDGPPPPNSGLALARSLVTIRQEHSLAAMRENFMRGAAMPAVLPFALSQAAIEALMSQFHGARSTGINITHLAQHGPETYRPERRRRSGRSGGALALTA